MWTQVIVLVAVAAVAVFANDPEPGTLSDSFDDIVVESALNVRKPSPQPGTTSQLPARQVREVPVVYLVAPQGRLYRVKRQFGGFGGFGQESSAANANAQNQYFGPNGFGASAANANAQNFQTQGPFGGFGAGAENAQTQAFNVGPSGISGSAGLSGGQQYNLPGGGQFDINYADTFAVGPNGKPAVSNADTINYKPPNFG